MTASHASLQAPLVYAVGWALLHFLWQGLLLALIWAALRAALSRQRPNVRYLAGCLILSAMVAAPFASCGYLLNRTSADGRTPATAAAGPDVAASSLEPPDRRWIPAVSVPLLDRVAAAVEMALPGLVGFWALGVGALSTRLARAGWSVHRLGSRQTGPVADEWIGRLIRLQERMRVSRPVRLMQSALVEVPTVAGWFRPVILLPASSLTGLTVAQLELILAHELAHIRRGDAWVNLAQVLAETVLFYHPAVWWVSRCVREEREFCCDDLAVQVCGNRLAYAQALTRLETLRGPTPAMALAAGGGSLLQRIRHVLGLPAAGEPRNWRLTAGAGLLGLGLVLFLVGLASFAGSPRQYQARARIVIEPDGISDPANRSPNFDPYFVRTESERLQSRALLVPVAERLALAQRWADREGRGQPLSTDAAVSRLRSALDVRSVRNTSLLEIRVYDEVAEDAAAIANALAETYRDQRLSGVRVASEGGVAALRKELDQANARVKETMERLDALPRDHRVSDLDESLQPRLDPEVARRLEAERVSATSEIDGLVALRNKLGEVQSRGGDDQLSKVMLNACPDQNLSRLLQDLWSAEAMLAKETLTYAADHPNIKSLQAMHKDLRRQVRECTDGLLAGLEVKVDAKRAQRDSLIRQVEEASVQDAERAARLRPYFIVRQDLENQMKIRDAILLRVLQETVEASIPKSSLVEIVDRAEPPRVPFYPGHRFGFGFCGLGMLSSIIGLGLRLSVRPTALPPASA